jgi:hypothetical protein
MSPAALLRHHWAQRPSIDIPLSLALVLALAVIVGAAYSAIGSGSLHDVLRSLGFGRYNAIEIEQRQQAADLAELDHIIRGVIIDVATMTARSQVDHLETNERVAKIAGDFHSLRTDMGALRIAVTREPWRKSVDHLNTAVTGVRGDMVMLRSSLDASELGNRKDIATMTRRIERLEQAIMRGSGASLRNTTLAQRLRGTQPLGTADETSESLSLRSNAGAEEKSGHLIDMTPARP